MSIFYTYFSYEEWGRGYIGYRKCPVGKTPETDSYMGSFKDQSFNPTAKEILGIYDSREEAMWAEIRLHKFFDVAKNPHFANKACSTSTKFCCYLTGSSHPMHGKNPPNKGKSPSSKSLIKMSEAKIGKNNPMYGKSHTKEAREKISKANKGKRYTKEVREKISKNKSKLRDWCHPNYGLVSQISALDLVRLFPSEKLSHGNLCNVALGKVCQHKGWRAILNEEETPTHA